MRHHVRIEHIDKEGGESRGVARQFASPYEEECAEHRGA